MFSKHANKQTEVPHGTRFTTINIQQHTDKTKGHTTTHGGPAVGLRLPKAKANEAPHDDETNAKQQQTLTNKKFGLF